MLQEESVVSRVAYFQVLLQSERQAPHSASEEASGLTLAVPQGQVQFPAV